MSFWDKVKNGATLSVAELMIRAGNVRLAGNQLGSSDVYYERLKQQTAFFNAIFPVMGYLARSDGRITQDEITVLREVMKSLKLGRKQRRLAAVLFVKGKSRKFELSEYLNYMRNEFKYQSLVHNEFLEILVRLALADGPVNGIEYEILNRVVTVLKLHTQRLDELVGQVKFQNSSLDLAMPTLAVDADYRLLGIEPECSDAELKQAYRRLMSKHHPDRVISTGAASELVRLANLQSHDINAAYNRILEARQSSEDYL